MFSSSSVILIVGMKVVFIGKAAGVAVGDAPATGV